MRALAFALGLLYSAGRGTTGREFLPTRVALPHRESDFAFFNKHRL